MATTPKRQPPVHIPIPVEQFVEGLLRIDPKKLPATAAKKKAAKKRRGMKAGASKSPGALRVKVGDEFGQIVVKERVENRENTAHPMFLCACRCTDGKEREITVRADQLTRTKNPIRRCPKCRGQAAAKTRFKRHGF